MGLIEYECQLVSDVETTMYFMILAAHKRKKEKREEGVASKRKNKRKNKNTRVQPPTHTHHHHLFHLLHIFLRGVQAETFDKTPPLQVERFPEAGLLGGVKNIFFKWEGLRREIHDVTQTRRNVTRNSFSYTVTHTPLPDGETLPITFLHLKILKPYKVISRW